MAKRELLTAADVQLMQGLAQRVTATRPDLVNSDASFGELAWNWARGTPLTARPGRACCGSKAVNWWRGAGAQLPHRHITGAYLAHQVHPDHAGLVYEVIDRFDGVAADVERTVLPSASDELGLQRWAAHGYLPEPAQLDVLGRVLRRRPADRGLPR